jgi:hypothetical protein
VHIGICGSFPVFSVETDVSSPKFEATPLNPKKALEKVHSLTIENP